MSEAWAAFFLAESNFNADGNFRGSSRRPWVCMRCTCPPDDHNGAGFCCNQDCPCAYKPAKRERVRSAPPALDPDEEEF